MDAALGREEGQDGVLVVAEDAGRDALAEVVAAGLGRHLADIAADERHGIAPVAHPRAMAAGGLRRAAVDDGDEVICDDDSVLAFLLGILRNDALLEDCHEG